MGGERGYDGGKKVTGRKRHVFVDTLGLVLAVSVTTAALDDAAGAPRVFQQIDAHDFPRLAKVWADNKYHNHALHAWVAEHRPQWNLEIVKRPKDAHGFVLLPKRWVVERTFAWNGRGRRHSKDYERRTDSSESMIKVTAIHQMLRRLSPSKALPEFHYGSAA